MIDVPVVCAISKNGDLSSSKGMSYSNFLKHYHDLLERVGFLFHSTPYAIRRGTANAIEGSGHPPRLRSHLTPRIGKLSIARRMQVMGHRDPRIFARNYISKTAFADVQSIVQGEDKQTDIIKKAQPLAVLWDEDAPSQLTQEEEAAVEGDHRLMECRSAVAKAKNNIQREYGSLRSAPSDVN